jgi:hypothetical protein
MKGFLQVLGLTFCMLNVSEVLSQPNFSWAVNIGSYSGEQPESIAADANGNVYTSGEFLGTIDLDAGPGYSPCTSLGSVDVFICKLDAAGNFVWGKSFGAYANDIAYSMALDASANIYLTGYFTGTVDFDPGAGTFNMTSYGLSDIYVLKLDANGNFLWAKQMGGNGDDEAHALALDNAGNIYTCGYFNNTADFDPGASTYTFTAAGQGDIFVSKLDNNGNFIWAKQMGSIDNEVPYGLAVDAAQNVYTTGNFFMSCDFDPGPATFNLSIAGNGAFISKLDMSGNFVWAKALSGSSSTGRCIKTDNAGNVYSTGYFESVCDFDPGAGTYTLAPSPLNQGDIFVWKLDATGNFVWVNAMGSTAYDIGTSLVLDAAQDIYVTGYFEGTVDFDPGVGTHTLTSAGSQDIFISKFNSLGNLVWAYNIGDVGSDKGAAINVDASNNIYTTGSFSGLVDVDPSNTSYTLTSTGPDDVYFHKMSQCVVPAAPANTTPTLNLLICQGNTTTLSATGSGTISWYSSQSSTTALGSGTSFVTPTLTAGTYTYYSEATTCTTSVNRTAVVFTVSACTRVSNVPMPNNVNLYPNPVSDILHISLDGHEACEVKIYNALGQLTFQKNTIDQHTKLDLSHLQKGIYFVELRTDTGCFTKKMIKD